MDQILRELAELLLKAVPTFLLVGLLYLYLKWVFFRPLERVLEARRQATEGTRKLAEQTLTKASAQAAHYQAALQAALSAALSAALKAALKAARSGSREHAH